MRGRLVMNKLRTFVTFILGLILLNGGLFLSGGVFSWGVRQLLGESGIKSSNFELYQGLSLVVLFIVLLHSFVCAVKDARSAGGGFFAPLLTFTASGAVNALSVGILAVILLGLQSLGGTALRGSFGLTAIGAVLLVYAAVGLTLLFLGKNAGVPGRLCQSVILTAELILFMASLSVSGTVFEWVLKRILGDKSSMSDTVLLFKWICLAILFCVLLWQFVVSVRDNSENGNNIFRPVLDFMVTSAVCTAVIAVGLALIFGIAFVGITIFTHLFFIIFCFSGAAVLALCSMTTFGIYVVGPLLLCWLIYILLTAPL